MEIINPGSTLTYFHAMRATILAFILAAAIPAQSLGQDKEPPSAEWLLRVRAVISGSSDHSEPAGYRVYSAISFEPSLCRKLGKRWSVEFSARFESHEVDYRMPGDNLPEQPLGSLELLPLNLFLRWEFAQRGMFHPYTSVGLNSTFCWEKSGELNTTDLSPSLGPALQAGLDVDFGKSLTLNFNAGWNAMETDMTREDVQLVHFELSPVVFGLGAGIRF